jgi:hypothetical protein
MKYKRLKYPPSDEFIKKHYLSRKRKRMKSFHLLQHGWSRSRKSSTGQSHLYVESRRADLTGVEGRMVGTRRWEEQRRRKN